MARVRGQSMLPTLQPGDLLLVWHGRQPQPGDVVLARLDADQGRLVVKRVATQVPEGWWLERDNPAVGRDSWVFGAVPRHDVRAVVVARLWPRPRRLARLR
jgi:phage repressor protein C with HTH and peptisase S24 domain